MTKEKISYLQRKKCKMRKKDAYFLRYCAETIAQMVKMTEEKCAFYC
jgi:hypothetical protein